MRSYYPAEIGQQASQLCNQELREPWWADFPNFLWSSQDDGGKSWPDGRYSSQTPWPSPACSNICIPLRRANWNHKQGDPTSCVFVHHAAISRNYQRSGSESMDWEYLRLNDRGKSFVRFTPFQGTCKSCRYNNCTVVAGIHLNGIVPINFDGSKIPVINRPNHNLSIKKPTTRCWGHINSVKRGLLIPVLFLWGQNKSDEW